MATITVPNDWHSTVVGILGAVGLVVQPLLSTGHVNIETIMLSVIVAVLGYFIPAKVPPAIETQAVQAVTTLIGDKAPAVLTNELTVSPELQKAIALLLTKATASSNSVPVP